jgi:Replication-relaxation
MSNARTSQRGVERLSARLSTRDLAVLSQVADLRLMSARQIGSLHFTGADHESPLAAARSCNRVLERMVRDRLLIRLDRRIGGVRAGSASFVYALGRVGQRVLALRGARLRFREPSEHFTDHTLAISELVVRLTLAGRAGSFELLDLQPEPRCWRRYAGSFGTVTLRPDISLTIGAQEFEYRWFIEVDQGSEHLPTVLTKCRAYDGYYRTGIEQRALGVFPRVSWIVPSQERAEALAERIADDRRLTTAMFQVTTTDQALTSLSGALP